MQAENLSKSLSFDPTTTARDLDRIQRIFVVASTRSAPDPVLNGVTWGHYKWPKINGEVRCYNPTFSFWVSDVSGFTNHPQPKTHPAFPFPL